MSLAKIEKAAEKYGAACLELTEAVTAANAEIEAIHQQHRPLLEKLAKKCAQARAVVHDLVSDNPECFEKPKTQTFAGIKVGFQKGKDTLDMDANDTVDRILKKLPDLKATLIQTTLKPIAAAIMNLDAKQQAAIGVTVVPGSDEVVVKPVDSAVSKAVSAHLKDNG